MTIREELKKLVAKLGGTSSKDDQTAELIHKITDQVESGGGGGASVFTVTFTPTDEEWTEFTSDKTFNEILAAYEAGSIIRGWYGTEELHPLQPTTVIDSLISFTSMEIITGNTPQELVYLELIVLNDNSIIFRDHGYVLTPVT